MSERKQGSVKWFNNAKGFGFILNENNEDLFVHHRSIQGEGFKTLKDGEIVTYLQITTDKGLAAVEVIRGEVINNDGKDIVDP